MDPAQIPAMPAPASATPPPEAPALTPESIEAKPDPKESDPGEFARRFANLNREAKRVHEDKRRLAEEKKAMEADRVDYLRWKKAREEKDAIGLLESAGLTYNDATAKVLGNKQLSPEEKIAEIEKRLDEQAKANDAEKKASEEQKARDMAEAQERTLEESKQWIRSHVEAQGDQYELIQSQNAHDMVLEVMEEYWNEHKALPDPDEACKHVEAWLEEQIRPLLSLKKFASKKEGEDLPAEGNNGKSQPQSFTLTNQSTAAPAQTRQEYLSDEESLKRAAAMIRWN